MQDHVSVCALVPYPLDTTPSQRFRIEQWQPYLASNGVTVRLLPFLDEPRMRLLYQPGQTVRKATQLIGACTRRLGDLLAALRADVVFVHRGICILGPALLERLLAWLRMPTIFDFDDAIYLLDTAPANRRFGWLKFPGKTDTLCRLSTHVVAGCEELAGYARRHNARVTIVPTSIDTDLYRPLPRAARRGAVVIGWSGSATSQAHLEGFADVLHQLVARRPEVELRVLSNRRPDLPGLPVVWRPWSRENEVEELRQFDIGIKPIPDDPWARGKCPMKELQYMALGVPAVCSTAGSAREAIAHGENGLLAATPAEWLSCLEALVDDATLRRRFGAAGRETVEARYSMRHCAARLDQVIRQTVR